MDKPVGEIRKLESLNRIVLPSEVRNIKNLKPLEYAEIYISWFKSNFWNSNG